MNLSSVQTLAGANDWFINFAVQADAGALLNLAGVTNVTGPFHVNVYADATNGVINLSGLNSFNNVGLLDARNGGAILVPNLAGISGLSLYVDGVSTLALPALNTIDAGNYGCTIEVAPGGVLNLVRPVPDRNLEQR